MGALQKGAKGREIFFQPFPHPRLKVLSPGGTSSLKRVGNPRLAIYFSAKCQCKRLVRATPQKHIWCYPISSCTAYQMSLVIFPHLKPSNAVILASVGKRKLRARTACIGSNQGTYNLNCESNCIQQQRY